MRIKPFVWMSIFLVVPQIAAILLSPFYRALGMQAFADPNNPVNPIFYIIMLLGLTAIILLLVKIGLEKMLRYLLLFAISVSFLFVIYPVLWFAVPFAYYEADIIIDVPFSIASFLTIVCIGFLFWYPEWYVINGIGLISAAGIAAILGISLGILPAFIILLGLAVYDAISVYRTKHMITLADSVTKMKLPVLLVVPQKSNYSFMKQEGILKQIETDEREAMFMGVGDVVIPAVLAVSSYVFLPDYPTRFGIPANLLTALCVITGIYVAFLFLMYFVSKGKPQAGLPFLNTGAIGSYVLAYLIIYRNFTLGLF
ncbi:MAG: presenilin family intramembrane aspartyl protease [Thermoplasmata archaeon]|nr:presenilin family intramembrane aspartyl protease [Thermoplasmata archaeon]